jgi:hypothetical protein
MQRTWPHLNYSFTYTLCYTHRNYLKNRKVEKNGTGICKSHFVLLFQFVTLNKDAKRFRCVMMRSDMFVTCLGKQLKFCFVPLEYILYIKNIKPHNETCHSIQPALHLATKLRRTRSTFRVIHMGKRKEHAKFWLDNLMEGSIQSCRC